MFRNDKEKANSIFYFQTLAFECLCQSNNRYYFSNFLKVSVFPKDRDLVLIKKAMELPVLTPCFLKAAPNSAEIPSMS